MHDWDEIRRNHGPMVWNAIGRILRNSEDITDCYQDVFLEAFQRSLTRSINNMPGLLRWLAVHRALDSLRKLKALPKIAANRNVDGITCDSARDTQRLNELLETVRCELSSLSVEQAECFWLCCVEGLKYREAAEVMGLETQHVGMLVHRARKHLSQALIDWHDGRNV
ncbi:RNA polymerase sigma factor [Aureliella helgolandensis]|uniref:ECF RNA polymerase sigma factor SigE n=1 Tax=Aureliella helgolandensis TaxID=2527968 RepID=A0A518GBK0_9BACT|nr:sigma-70 family RNA polymerase sigma factor [Aureliella helgolandensis]QDV25910.1 ECF RNA polymerase sigma factor SigE [Aureliella helgolandensis]